MGEEGRGNDGEEKQEEASPNRNAEVWREVECRGVEGTETGVLDKEIRKKEGEEKA